MMFSKPIPSLRLILIMAAFFTLTMNYSLFSHLLAAYPLNAKNVLFLLSFAVGYTGLTALIFALLSFKHTLKPALIVVLFFVGVKMLLVHTSYKLDTGVSLGVIVAPSATSPCGKSGGRSAGSWPEP